MTKRRGRNVKRVLYATHVFAFVWQIVVKNISQKFRLEFSESGQLSICQFLQALTVRRIKKKAETEIFVCDNCGNRKRLASAQRHWCDNCTFGVPVEMRCAKDKWKRPREGEPVPEKRF